jgi:hypothetical protein
MSSYATLVAWELFFKDRQGLGKALAELKQKLPREEFTQVLNEFLKIVEMARKD